MEELRKDEHIHKTENSNNLKNVKECPKIEVSDNLVDEKENTSLKNNLEPESEQKLLKPKKKEKTMQNDKTSEIVTSTVLIISFICFVIYYFFSGDYTEEPLFNDYKKEKIQSKKEELEICQFGYYVPQGHTHCHKCSVENCSKCRGRLYRDKCLSCQNSFVPIYDKEKNIKKCIIPCELGENEKCATCSGNICGSCHKGYNLVKGKCILNHSIKGFYITTHINESIIFINENYVKYINELIIDGHHQKKISYNYIFPKAGIHTIIMRLNTTNLDSGKKMFFNIPQLIVVNFTRMFNTEKMISMKGMFKDCIYLNSIGLSEFKTDKVEDFSYMFDNCSSLPSINISNFNTKNVKNINNMFSNCKSLKSISLKKFNTIQIVDMSGLFSGCSSLISINLSSFKTENTKFMQYMFAGCTSLKQLDISSFTSPKLNDISYMFKDCANLKFIDLKKFNSE